MSNSGRNSSNVGTTFHTGGAGVGIYEFLCFVLARGSNG